MISDFYSLCIFQLSKLILQLKAIAHGFIKEPQTWSEKKPEYKKRALQVKKMEPGQNVMIAHMTTQVEMGMKEWKKDKKAKASQG